MVGNISKTFGCASCQNTSWLWPMEALEAIAMSEDVVQVLWFNRWWAATTACFCKWQWDANSKRSKGVYIYIYMNIYIYTQNLCRNSFFDWNGEHDDKSHGFVGVPNFEETPRNRISRLIGRPTGPGNLENRLVATFSLSHQMGWLWFTPGVCSWFEVTCQKANSSWTNGLAVEAVVLTVKVLVRPCQTVIGKLTRCTSKTN